MARPPAGRGAVTATSNHGQLYSSSFLPASLGNRLACFKSSSINNLESNAASSTGKSGSAQSKSKGKGKASSNLQSDAQEDVRFIEFDALQSGRRSLVTESYTVFASLQTVANGSRSEPEVDPFREADGRSSLQQRFNDIPQPEQIAYYARFAQLYRDCLSRYLSQLAAEAEIDTDELSLARDMRDAFHLTHIVYVPNDGRGDGIVAEEIVEYLNTTSPWPSQERRDNLTGRSAPYEENDFWGFIYSCILRGHTSLASTVLKTLLLHPSGVLKRLTQNCLDIITSLPRSHSPAYTYESDFLHAIRQWRSRISALLARLDMEMDDFQDEITDLDAQGSASSADGADSDIANACADERFTWEAGFKCLLMLLLGDVNSIIDAAEDGWKSALSAWALLVRPGLKRDDLPDAMQGIVERLPPDATLFREALAVALLSGDVPKVVRLAAEHDTWLAAHLCDMMDKLGLLIESDLIDDVTLRDYFILSYTNLLVSDPGLWRCTIDYLASLDNAAIGRGRMKEILLAIGSTASPDVDAEEAVKHEIHDVAVQVEKQAAKPTTVEDVLAVCATYGLEDVTRSLCLITAETLITQRKFGLAVAYSVRSNDARRLNKIADIILDEYIKHGVEALMHIDAIPTSLLQPSGSGQPFLINADGMYDGQLDEDEQSSHNAAYALASSTRLRFLARYRDFHALYASGDRTAAAHLLTLLMSSNEAPKSFWAVMLLDAVPLLNDATVLIDEADTLELMRCLTELVTPVQHCGKDMYGYLSCLNTVTGQDGNASTDEDRVTSAIKQLDVVRYALASNLAKCFLRQ